MALALARAAPLVRPGPHAPSQTRASAHRRALVREPPSGGGGGGGGGCYAALSSPRDDARGS
jgi:hypothetical protein